MGVGWGGGLVSSQPTWPWHSLGFALPSQGPEAMCPEGLQKRASEGWVRSKLEVSLSSLCPNPVGRRQGLALAWWQWVLASQHAEGSAGQEHIQQKQFEEKQTQCTQPQDLTWCPCRRRRQEMSLGFLDLPKDREGLPYCVGHSLPLSPRKFLPGV